MFGRYGVTLAQVARPHVNTTGWSPWHYQRATINRVKWRLKRARVTKDKDEKDEVVPGGDSSGVGEHADGPVHLGQVLAQGHRGRLICSLCPPWSRWDSSQQTTRYACFWWDRRRPCSACSRPCTCRGGRWIVKSFFVKYQNVHVPNLFSMVVPFQNCFCFLSSPIISGEGKKFGLQ